MPYQRNFALLPTGTTANAAPATLTDATLGAALPVSCDQAVILVQSTAGSGVMTATLKLWAFNTELARWYDIGLLNGGNPIGESKADVLESAFGVMGLRAFDRLYVEVVGALGGTSTAIKVDGVAIHIRDGA